MKIGGLIERRRFDLARQHLATALKGFPEHPRLLYQAAYIDYITDRCEDARSTLAVLLKLDPEDADARELLARVLAEERQFAESERIWIALLRDHPQEPGYFGGYAHLMLKTMHLDKARRLANEGLRLAPEDHDCLFVAALCEVAQYGGGKDEVLIELLRQHPDSAASAAVLVVALQERGDFRGAHRVAQDLLRAQPDNAVYLGLVRELRAATHWSMWPLYPLQRWGWGASAAIWVLVIGILKTAERTVSPAAVNAIALVWIAYVLYSWVWPRVLRKLI
ncbi:MAG TPA: tetratricopeptide repeat protein [Steroidobacteraceae bacterium]|nr:tetratricopeptide repeat protein [Steroidobacteraceae bacterium]